MTEKTTEKTAAEKQKAAEPRSASAKAGQASDESEVLADPFPGYDDMPLGELRAAAKARNVEINRDVEKAELVHLLREKDPSPGYDLMPLDDLRSKAAEVGVALGEEFERAHLATELRAADTHTG